MMYRGKAGNHRNDGGSYGAGWLWKVVLVVSNVVLFQAKLTIASSGIPPPPPPPPLSSHTSGSNQQQAVAPEQQQQQQQRGSVTDAPPQYHQQPPSPPPPQLVVIGIDGGTESIRACCFDAQTGQVVGSSCAVSYATHHPQPGWAEQDPYEWYHALGQAVRGAVASLRDANQQIQIAGLCVDTTCCSVVALNKDYQPLRPSLLWMDQRSAAQTRQILEECRGDPALAINSDGQGPLSAEWMIPKALWLFQNELEQTWQPAAHICEYQDYINFCLTGRLCASACNAATRWHWHGEEALQPATPENPHPGRPVSLYQTLGIPELAEKLPRDCLPMGATVGYLHEAAARHCGLSSTMYPIPVIQGGPDAFVGMIGLGCVHPQQLCLITGSSHLHCVVSSKPDTAPGTWGAYPGAPLPGLFFAEGGQSSTGSILRWAKQKVFGTTLTMTNNDGTTTTTESPSYKQLDEEASQIPPGANGLVALETFQGSRTPITDPSARGALVGLTLSHTRAHIWRALMEAVCFGTRACVDALERAGHSAREIVLAGGITRSPLWLQLHADITNRTIVVCENSDAPLLGCAVLASVGLGIHATVPDAVQSMVRRARTILPRPAEAQAYSDLYERVYSKLANAVRPISHALQGAQTEEQSTIEKNSQEQTPQSQSPSTTTTPIAEVSPSLLSCDFGNIAAEVRRCLAAGAVRLHVDVFDGVAIKSPNAFTFGPDMVHRIHREVVSYQQEHASTNHNDVPVSLDLHMCVDRPKRFVEAMQAATANGENAPAPPVVTRFIFQWEAMPSLYHALELARYITQSGMECGVSLNPSTPLEGILPLLEYGLVSVVDVLAVEPGFGGQEFQDHTLDKIRQLKEWRDSAISNGSSKRRFDILVDGGVNRLTAPRIRAAGADIIVSGSFLFRHADGLRMGMEELVAS